MLVISYTVSRNGLIKVQYNYKLTLPSSSTMITVVWLLPTIVTPVVGLTTLSDTVNISFASKILSLLVVMLMHLSVVSVAVNVLVSDTGT